MCCAAKTVTSYEIEWLICHLSICCLALVVSQHIRNDQGKTADSNEDTTRHMQCKYPKKHAFLCIKKKTEIMKEWFVSFIECFPPRQNSIPLCYNKHNCFGQLPNFGVTAHTKTTRKKFSGCPMCSVDIDGLFFKSVRSDN